MFGNIPETGKAGSIVTCWTAASCTESDANTSLVFCFSIARPAGTQIRCQSGTGLGNKLQERGFTFMSGSQRGTALDEGNEKTVTKGTQYIVLVR
jgi:hypothetical protein